MSSKLLVAGLFFVFTFLSGLWLSRSGRPLSVAILTIHKLISLAALVTLITTVYRAQQAGPLGPLAIAACAASLVFFIAMFATGGLLSSARTMPGAILKAHQFMPFLVMLSSATAVSLIS